MWRSIRREVDSSTLEEDYELIKMVACGWLAGVGRLEGGFGQRRHLVKATVFASVLVQCLVIPNA